VQPGGRSAAPGALALVQSFINTHYDLEVEHGADVFATAPSLAGWLAAHRLIDPAAARVGERDLRRMVTVRESLRALAARNGDYGRADPGAAASVRGAIGQLNQSATGAQVEIRFTPEGADFVAHDRGGIDAALGRLLAIVAVAMVDGSWSRLKVCPGENCGWAFFDHSRNQSGRWCSMAVCGGRAKARAHYRRRRDGRR
jgi:predicted RNA-binding Zn ribbon-like protein